MVDPRVERERHRPLLLLQRVAAREGVPHRPDGSKKVVNDIMTTTLLHGPDQGYLMYRSPPAKVTLADLPEPDILFS